MRHQASFRFPCPPVVATDVAAALALEAADAPEDVTVSCQAGTDGLHLDIEADSLGGLRAASQGIVRLADAALRVSTGKE